MQSDKVGSIIGVILAEQSLGKPRGWDFFQNIDAQLHHAWTDPHFPDLNSVRYDLTGAGDLAQLFKGSVMAVLAGEIGKELNIDPRVTKVSKVAQKLGMNVGFATVGVALVERSTLKHSPVPDPTKGNSRGKLGAENPMLGVYNL